MRQSVFLAGLVLVLAGAGTVSALQAEEPPSEQRPSRIVTVDTPEKRAERIRQAVSDHKWFQDMTRECLAGNVGFSRIPSENWC